MILVPETWCRFLSDHVISYNLLYIDLWSGIHFFWGLVLGIFALVGYNKYGKSNKFWFSLILSLLVLYEIWEFRFWDRLFYHETLINIIYDLIIGFTGFVSVFLLGKEIEVKKIDNEYR